MRKLSFFRTLALPALLLAGCTATPEVDTILDRAEQALGGPRVMAGLDTLRLETQGTWGAPALGIPPMPYEGLVVIDLPDRIYWEIRPQGGEKMVSGFDGKEAWSAWNGPPARVTGWARQGLIDGLNDFKALLVGPARAGKGAEFTLLSSRPEGDPPAWKIRYRPAQGEEWTLWFDPTTGAMVRSELDYIFMMDGGKVHGTRQWGAYKDFGAIRFPSRGRFRGSREGRLFEEVIEKYKTVEVNEKIPENLFRYPKPGLDGKAVRIKTVPARTVAVIEHRGPFTAMGATIKRLKGLLAQAGLMSMGPMGAIYLAVPGQVPEPELKAEVFCSVMLMGPAPKLPPGLALKQVPPLKVAWTYHLGDHREEGEAHERLQRFLAEKGLKAAAPPRAVWFHDPEITVTEDLVSEVRIPVE